MSGFVYFIKPIGMLGPIKIGHSEEPRARLMSLSTWSPLPLEVIVTVSGSRALECNIQDCFAHLHSHREWFHAERDLLVFVQKLKDGLPIEQAVDLTKRVGSIKSKLRDTSPDDRLCSRYNLRIASACRKAERALGPDTIIKEPPFVTEIMKGWRGVYRCGRTLRGQKPAGQLLEEVERFLSDPKTLGTRYSRRALSAPPQKSESKSGASS